MLKCLRKGTCTGLLLAGAAAMFFVLAAHPATAWAAAGRNGRAPVFLKIDVALSYAKDLGRDSGGNKIDGKSMEERVRLTYGAYIVDPRLATYVTTLTFENQDSSGAMGEKSRLVAGTFNASFFNRVNRSKGAGLWRYVPSPMTVGIAHSESTRTATTNYTFGAYYMLPGYMVLFDRGSWVSYNLTGKTNANNASNANRYRLKFSDDSLNYNRNGSGNYNRNGNGNYNRNGNGNYNRNGNGNYNRNGNGNWNRNGNGNWNRNGNGNWNNQNRNGNGEPDLNGKAEGGQDGNYSEAAGRRPYVFRFPTLSLNMGRTDTRYKSGDGGNGSTQYGDIRSQTSSADNREGQYYHSDYELHYHWYETMQDRGADQQTRQLDLDAENSWRRLKLHNRFEKYESEVAQYQKERMLFESTAHWRDDQAIDYFIYDIGAGLNYNKYNDEDSQYTFLSGLAELRYSKSRRISSKLRADSYARALYAASRYQGERDTQQDSWRLDASETLVSRHMDHIEGRLAGTVGHDEFGTPLTAALSATTIGLPRLSAFSEYTYTTVISRRSDGEYQRNTFTANCRYFLTIFLDIFGKFHYENFSDIPSGAPHTSTYGSHTESEGVVTWRPKAGLTLSGHTLLRTTDSGDFVENGISANKVLGRRSSMTASATVDTRSTTPGRHESYAASYIFTRPKFYFSFEYQNDKWYQGWVENRIYMKVHRTFGRR